MMLAWNNRTKLLSALAVAAIYLALAWWMTISYVDPTPKGRIVLRIRKPFETYAGMHMALYRELNTLTDLADSEDDPRRSPILLYEDYQLLGPAHSSHRDIAVLGNGRYSHWKTHGLLFSTSDNSDPNTNGRVYLVVVPE
jgi:hypothetical protein